MTRIDVMVDIETLGTDANATIFQIAAVAFDLVTGDTYETFNRAADIAENTYMKVDGATIKWWLNTDADLLKELLNSGKGTSYSLIRKFHEWLSELSEEGELFLWGNGILFDNNMLKTQMEGLRLRYPVDFRNDRDVRTLLELASKKTGETPSDIKARFTKEDFVAHDAFQDVMHQIAYVSYCYQELAGLEENV